MFYHFYNINQTEIKTIFEERLYKIERNVLDLTHNPIICRLKALIPVK
jgi:hypothetical protein